MTPDETHEIDDTPRWVYCPRCNGRGHSWESPDEWVTSQVDCFACRGEGGAMRYGVIVRGEE